MKSCQDIPSLRDLPVKFKLRNVALGGSRSMRLAATGTIRWSLVASTSLDLGNSYNQSNVTQFDPKATGAKFKRVTAQRDLSDKTATSNIFAQFK